MHFGELGAQHRCRHQLGNAVAAADRERFSAEVDEDDLHFAAIVAVDGPWRVEAGDAMLDGEARARPYLNLIAVRNFDCEAGRNGVPLAWPEVEVLGRPDVQTGRGFAGILRQRR